jgi:Mn2+/Fe2+ NRAMP family transporter
MTATQADVTTVVAPSALDRLLARGRIRGALAMLGPAFVASVAYVDPGNFATNIQGGAWYGYLLWVVLAANLMAMLVPSLDGAGSLYLAVGILGATVMPHVIYLHSALTKERAPSRDDRDRHRLLRFQKLDVLTALGLAGLVNMAMLAVAARAFHTPALAGLDTIGQAHAELGRLAGGGAALVFAVALLASGVSSSSVRTYADEVILTSRRDVMGAHVNQRRTIIAGGMCVAVIIALNILLLGQQLRA